MLSFIHFFLFSIHSYFFLIFPPLFLECFAIFPYISFIVFFLYLVYFYLCLCSSYIFSVFPPFSFLIFLTVFQYFILAPHYFLFLSFSDMSGFSLLFLTTLLIPIAPLIAARVVILLLSKFFPLLRSLL